MNKITKQYVKNVKDFFPMSGKGEKKYLENLELNIEDFCEEVSILSLEELYEKFGTPSEVVNDYYSSVDTDYILKQMSKSKLIRRLIIALIAAVVISTLAYGSYLYAEYRTLQRQAIFFEEVIIE